MVRDTEDLSPPTNVPAVAASPEPDEDPWGDDGLTHRQRLFVHAYVGPAAGNATRAAAMAGYSDSNVRVLTATGSRLLTFVNVQRAIASAVAAKLGGPEWTLSGIAEIADGNMASYLQWDETHTRVVGFDLERAAADGAMGRVRELRIRDTEAGRDVTVKLYDRMEALKTLAKYHGMVVDRSEVSVTTPRQQMLGKILRDPAALAIARQLSQRLSEIGAEPPPPSGN